MARLHYSDDPVADYEAYDRDCTEAEEQQPHCDRCGEACWDSYYRVNDEIICESCMEDMKVYL